MDKIQRKLDVIGNAIREKTGKEELLSLDEMPAEIAAIETGVDTSDATAVANEILESKTAYIKDGKITGSMPNLSARTSITFGEDNLTPIISGDAVFIKENTDNVSRILIRYTGENGYLQSNTLFGYDSSAFGNATSNQVVKGATFTSKNGVNIAGSYEGVELNFEIVGGTAEPVNPTENMIWINTDTEITVWTFSATEPTEPIDGTVWISTGTDSNVEFNGLKNNSLQIYPRFIRQYISGEWIDRTGKIYKNGEWCELTIDIVVFDNGDNTEVTGGWTTGGGVGTFTVDTSLNFHAAFGSSSAYAVTNNAVDLTDYCSIIVNCDTIGYDTDGRSKVYVSSSFGSDMTAYVAITHIGEYIMDVSNLTGLFYIGLFSKSNGAFSVNKIMVKR